MKLYHWIISVLQFCTLLCRPVWAQEILDDDLCCPSGYCHEEGEEEEEESDTLQLRRRKQFPFLPASRLKAIHVSEEMSINHFYLLSTVTSRMAGSIPLFSQYPQCLWPYPPSWCVPQRNPLFRFLHLTFKHRAWNCRSSCRQKVFFSCL